MPKDNYRLLGELTSNTNKELFKTNKFVSDGYIETYIIRSSDISTEFKYEYNKTSCQTIINLFKDLKNRKLTIFYLKINKIVNITNVKINELEGEFTKFLKSQSNL